MYVHVLIYLLIGDARRPRRRAERPGNGLAGVCVYMYVYVYMYIYIYIYI